MRDDEPSVFRRLGLTVHMLAVDCKTACMSEKSYQGTFKQLSNLSFNPCLGSPVALLSGYSVCSLLHINISAPM